MTSPFGYLLGVVGQLVIVGFFVHGLRLAVAVLRGER